MKTIALLGSPGAGKSTLAEAIKNELIRGDGQCEECNTPVSIVDDYAMRVRDPGVYKIGLDGGYMADITMASQRYMEERFAYHEHGSKTTIICGTVIETAVYTAMHFERTLALKQTDEEKFEEAKRFEGCVSLLAVLFMDTFKYDKAFYLPPLAYAKDERWATFDRNLQAAFQAYNAPVVPLVIEEYTDDTDLLNQQVKRVLE